MATPARTAWVNQAEKCDLPFLRANALVVVLLVLVLLVLAPLLVSVAGNGQTLSVLSLPSCCCQPFGCMCVSSDFETVLVGEGDTTN